MDWKGLLFKPGSGEVAEGAEPAAELTPVPEAKSGGGKTSPPRQIVISDLIGLGDQASASVVPIITTSAGESVTTGPSPQALKLVEQALAAVPGNNATVQLRNMMASLESVIPDTETRRKAALAALSGQGISEEAVMAGTQQARQFVTQALDSALAQVNSARSTTLAAKRGEAQSIRDQIAAIDRQIQDLAVRKDELIVQAQTKDSDAAEFESRLDTLNHDIEVARTIANDSFGPQ
jgi:hypothetical protein